MSSPDPTGTRLGFEHVFERGSSASTLLLLHSTGGDERQLVGLGRQLAPDANLLSPRGKVLEQGVTRRFFARRGIHDLDIPDLKARTDELADFVSQAVDAYDLDADRLTAAFALANAGAGRFRQQGRLRRAGRE
jgi:predicted esterase